ncbi:hypothetical protein PISL3812_09167 [Talaromyces islandicus]|uniref:Uncharacterized protein n=1 Tax=Talaromyces islandicus TaxID=28573 RepID=A0A0U1M9U4_TALIS|nr:hypothetical protein PISL3812_09167 [Talaromyces islandicus]
MPHATTSLDLTNSDGYSADLAKAGLSPDWVVLGDHKIESDNDSMVVPNPKNIVTKTLTPQYPELEHEYAGYALGYEARPQICCCKYSRNAAGMGPIAKVARDGEGIGSVAKIRTAMKSDDIASLGKIFSDNDGKLQGIVKACKLS